MIGEMTIVTTMPQKILIIDDDINICDIICKTAADMGIACLATTDATSFFDSLTPDVTLVMIDLVMPNVDGIEILRILGEKGCSANVVVMSGVDKRIIETAEILTRTLGLSTVEHLSKPFRISTLESLFGSAVESVAVPNDETRRVHCELDELRGAIERDEFVLHYQPQVEIATNRIAAVEALVRWQHPTHGLVYPNDFVEYAEQVGLIDELTRIVIRKGLSEMGALTDESGRPIMLALNLSAVSLRDLAFPDFFASMIAEYGVAAESIVLEITETGLIRELSKTLDVLTRLRMKKVELSIDDFGTGYSMMQQLSHIPANQLKIDRSFVMNLHNEQERVIVEKTIEIGHDLGMTVVAEGVENREQLELLRRKNCDLAQGFVFSKPLPKSEFMAWLLEYSKSESLSRGPRQ
jgi:EAL domain-containing protein (putative c-di-GMP-specific phosphodiesterase class I)/ActR/RegA family two-component response regulator